MVAANARTLFVPLMILSATTWIVCETTAEDPKPSAPAAFSQEDPRGRSLDANLSMQTSAEYRACCLQAYNFGALRLNQLLDSGEKRGKTCAVVMDLDETVLDNAGFQAMLTRSGMLFDQRVWNLWQANHADKVGAIPGAIKFIQMARKRDVATVFISNRDETYRAQTKDVLKRLGIPVEGEKQLKLATTTSDKTRRREEAETDFDVLLYFGDNLRDFSEEFKCPDLGGKTNPELSAAIQARKDRVDAKESNWGDRWIILPNSAYGEWTKPLGLGTRDFDRLVPETK